MTGFARATSQNLEAIGEFSAMGVLVGVSAVNHGVRSQRNSRISKGIAGECSNPRASTHHPITKAHGVSIEAPFCFARKEDCLPYGPVTSFWTVAPAFAAVPVWLMTCEIAPLPPPSDTVTMFRNRTPGATGASKA